MSTKYEPVYHGNDLAAAFARASTAAKVRKDKEAHPEMFCADPRCLWRTGGPRGTPCRKHPTPRSSVAPTEPVSPPSEGLGLTLDLDRDGWTRGFQLSLTVTKDGKPQHGYRLAGPKYNGSSTNIQRRTLTQHDADEIRRMLDRVFPSSVLAPITTHPVALNPEAWGDITLHRPRLRPGEAGYYPSASTAAGGEKLCLRFIGGYNCTRERGHEPPCAAHDNDLGQIATVSLPEDDDAPRCYVRGCGAIEDLEPAGFPGQSLWVCPDCKASQQHQRELAGEFALEGAE